MSSPLSRHVAQPPRGSAVALSDRVRWPQGSLVALLADTERGGMVKVTVAAETGAETTLAVRSRGDLIGEFAVLDGMPRTATARAVGTVGAIRIGRSAFAAFAQRYPAALATITRSLVA